MSKIIRTSKPSVLPWYAAALVFVVLCAVLPAYKLWALLIALGGAAVMFGAAKKICWNLGKTGTCVSRKRSDRFLPVLG